MRPALDVDTHDMDLQRRLLDESLPTVAALELLGLVRHVHSSTMIAQRTLLLEHRRAI